MNAKADFFFVKNSKWQKELETLRKTILAIGLNEELKWGVPCYTINKKNIVLIHAFKEYCAVLFFKGAFAKLTPGRQRGYLLFFSSAKQSKTRDSRIDKNVKRILAGKGLDD